MLSKEHKSNRQCLLRGRAKGKLTCAMTGSASMMVVANWSTSQLLQSQWPRTKKAASSLDCIYSISPVKVLRRYSHSLSVLNPPPPFRPAFCGKPFCTGKMSSLDSCCLYIGGIGPRFITNIPGILIIRGNNRNISALVFANILGAVAVLASELTKPVHIHIILDNSFDIDLVSVHFIS